MAITAFPALAPCLRLVTYPDNLKPNIKKYDKCSDPYIWLLTYYVAVKAAGGNFDHMAAYFPLVMGDAPSLCINNIPAGSITSWADLQSTWKCLQPREGDHEDQRAASRTATPVLASGTTRSSTATRRASKIARSLRRSMSQGPP
jgi:hypothetical protein